MTIRRVAVLAVIGALLALPASSSARPQACPANLLVTLPSVGVVTWRSMSRPGGYQLVVRIFEATSTTRIRLVAKGQLVAERSVDPGSAWALPEAGLRQRLEIRQFTGAGTLRASIDAHFERPLHVVSHCYPYAPPDMTVRLRARR